MALSVIPNPVIIVGQLMMSIGLYVLGSDTRSDFVPVIARTLVVLVLSSLLTLTLISGYLIEMSIGQLVSGALVQLLVGWIPAITMIGSSTPTSQPEASDTKDSTSEPNTSDAHNCTSQFKASFGNHQAYTSALERLARTGRVTWSHQPASGLLSSWDRAIWLLIRQSQQNSHGRIRTNSVDIKYRDKDKCGPGTFNGRSSRDGRRTRF